MSASVAVILNPRAGGNLRATDRRERLEEALGSDGTVHVPVGLEDLGATIRRALADDPRVLALCGGDGSYFRAFSALHAERGEERWPDVLPLPAGTINNLGHAIGQQASRPERVLARVVANLRAGIALEVVELDLFRVGEGHVGYIFGAGMIVNFLRAYYAGGESPGRADAARLLLRLIGSSVLGGSLHQHIFQPFEADLICDGERVPHRRFRQVICSSVRSIGLGFAPFYLAGRKPGHFHVLGGPATGAALVRRLPRYYRGAPARDPDMYDNIGGHLQIEFDTPTAYTVNGDLLDPVRTLELHAHRRVRVVRG